VNHVIVTQQRITAEESAPNIGTRRSVSAGAD